MAISLRLVAEGHHAQRVLGESGKDQLHEGQGHLLGGSDAVLAVEDHAVADVDHQHRGARGEVLGLEHLEVLLADGDLVGPRALHRVGDGAQRVDLADGIAEAPRTGLGEALVALPRVRHPVLAEARLRETREDARQGVPADGLLALRGERPAAVLHPLDDALALEAPAELLEVDVGVEVPALLQLAQPPEHLVHVARGHQQQVVEQAHQVREAPEQRLEGPVPLGVLELHAGLSSGRSCPCARTCSSACPGRRRGPCPPTWTPSSAGAGPRSPAP